MNTESIDRAARWLAAQDEVPQPVLRRLMEDFHITAVEAAKACTRANEYRILAAKDAVASI